MGELKEKLERRYPIVDTSEKLRLIRISRDMIYEHCVKEAKQQ